MTVHPDVLADIFGKLLLIQETLDAMPDAAGIAGFLHRSLSEVPGVSDVHLSVGGEVHPPSTEYGEVCATCEAVWKTSGVCPEYTVGDTRVICLPLRTARQLHGMLVLSLGDEAAFAPYRPFVRNIANVVATTFETREHLRQLDEAKAVLEAQVAERTATLKESEEKFRALVETTSDWAWEVDAAGTFIYASPMIEALLGFKPEEVVGKTPFDFMPPEEAQRRATEFLAASRAARPLKQVLHTHLHKDGHEVEMESSGIPIFDAMGNVAGYRGIDRDVTARQRTVEALRDSENKFRLLSACAPDAIIMLNRDGRITDWNAAAERIFGHPAADAIGRDLHMLLVPARQHSAVRRGLVEFRKSGTGPMINKTLEITALRRGGTEFPAELSISSVRLLGQWHAIGIVRDVSERNQLQSQFLQAQKMESVGRLAGGVAHDFNNMLTAILGYVELSLLRLGAAHDVAPYIEEIRKAAERSAALTRQLLAFARKEAVELKVLNLNQATESILKMLRRLLGENVTQVWTPGNALWNVKADAAEIDQVLANLAVNARDAMTGRDARLEIETSNVVLDADFVASHPGAVPGEFVLVRVTDNGCGMDAHTLANIFEPFFTTKARGVGTGLGMSTVYGIMKQHNGFIDVESTLGVGTTVHLYLPRTTEVAEAAESGPVRAMRRGGETVLLVDDEECVRTSIGEMLRHLGYQVLLAPGGTEAVALAARHTGSIDLVLTDVIMNGMNGIHLRDELRKLFPDVAVLFMSGYADEVISTLGVLEAGINFMQKPIAMRILADAVRNSLDTPTSLARKFAPVPGWKV